MAAFRKKNKHLSPPTDNESQLSLDNMVRKSILNFGE